MPLFKIVGWDRHQPAVQPPLIHTSLLDRNYIISNFSFVPVGKISPWHLQRGRDHQMLGSSTRVQSRKHYVGYFDKCGGPHAAATGQFTWTQGCRVTINISTFHDRKEGVEVGWERVFSLLTRHYFPLHFQMTKLVASKLTWLMDFSKIEVRLGFDMLKCITFSCWAPRVLAELLVNVAGLYTPLPWTDFAFSYPVLYESIKKNWTNTDLSKGSADFQPGIMVCLSSQNS